MNPDAYKPRFSFEITQTQKDRSEKLLSGFGVKRSLFSVILDDTLDMIELHGEKFIIALTSRLAKPREILHSVRGAEEVVRELEHKDG